MTDNKNMKKILICDDADFIRSLLKETLSDNYELTLSADGPTAINYAFEQKFDLIIMDIKMPEINGLRVIERIRKIDQQVPIIIFTAYPINDDDERLIKNRVSKVIRKPADINHIRDIIRQLLD